jgi:DNA-directed RNA polymerase specialized sigma24 family protein
MVLVSGFPVTRWTLVLSASQNDRQAADEALAELCGSYWYPIYAFIRRLGNSPDSAQDLTQEFFARFIAKRHVAYADPARGRFRSFLLTSVKRFLADQADRRNADKRGGRQETLAIDLADAEKRYGAALADRMTPEKLFERAWAGTLMARATEHVRTDFVREGRQDQFEQLKQFLPGYETTLAYSDLAQRAGMSEGALKVAVHRLRRRYREVFRAEVAHLVAEEDQIDDELRYVLDALRA